MTKIKIYKFGGASVKDTSSITNVAKLLKNEGCRNTFLVISAMSKMTNAFEDVLHKFLNDKDQFDHALKKVKDFHFKIINTLFNNKTNILSETQSLFKKYLDFLEQNIVSNYDYIYDQTVIYGELLSTKIVSAYLNEIGIENTWLDARELIFTDDNYRDARVNWEKTCQEVKKYKIKDSLLITQGFIGSALNKNSTTLGREGSDYTAAILAHCLDAQEVTIWKDVEGLLNADPRFFDETKLIQSISYQDALEMAFYGASVIHPKTIKPLQNKNIPLKIRSFSDSSNPGSIICQKDKHDDHQTCFTKKENQILINLQTNDFSFIFKKNTSHIFSLLDVYKINLNLIQNSAISASICIEDPFQQLKNLVSSLEKNFQIQVYESVNLFSVFHYDKVEYWTFLKGRKLLLRQQNEHTIHFVTD